MAAALMVATAFPVAAQQYGLPAMLQGVGIEQKLDSQLPLEATFRDETGAPVRLGNYFRGRPVIVNLVYYQCPMLCNMVLTGMVNTLRHLDLNPGTDFDIVTISFDPSETPQLAAAKRETYLAKYNRPGAAASWHFLTGDDVQIHKVTDAIGFAPSSPVNEWSTVSVHGHDTLLQGLGGGISLKTVPQPLPPPQDPVPPPPVVP